MHPPGSRNDFNIEAPMEYRLLREEEFDKIEAVFRDEMKIPLPRKGQDLVLVGEDDGRVVIIACLQMVAMLGLYVDPRYRGSDEYKTVAGHIDILAQYNKLQGYTLATSHIGAKRMARLAGMKETDMTFYVKVFGD